MGLFTKLRFGGLRMVTQGTFDFRQTFIYFRQNGEWAINQILAEQLTIFLR